MAEATIPVPAEANAAGLAPTRRWHWVALLVILVAAAGLRAHRLGAEGFWIDEFLSLESSVGKNYAEMRLPTDRIIEPPAPRLMSLDDAVPVHRLWGTFGDDQHPPLYFVTLRLWRELFGSSDVACRALSLLCSLLAIALLFDIGRLLLGPTVALWACALMATAQSQILYAQEARSYTMMTALGLAAVAAVVRIEKFGFTRRRGLALAAAMLATVLTHYFGVATCAALGLYVLIRFRGPQRARALLAMGMAAGAFAVVWLPWAIDQLDGLAIQSRWLDDDARGSRLANWLRRIRNLPVRLFADTSRSPGLTPIGGALLLVLPWLRLRRVPAMLLPMLIVAACLALPAALDLARSTRQLDFTRFAIAAVPGLALIVPAMLSDSRRWLGHVLPAVFLLYCVTNLQWTFDATKPEWRRLGQDIGRMARDGDLVLYRAPWVGSLVTGAMYLAVERYAPELRVPCVVMTRPLSGEALDRARVAGRVWLAHDRSDPDVANTVPGFEITATYYQSGVGFLYRLEPAGRSPSPPGGTDTSSTPTGRDR